MKADQVPNDGQSAGGEPLHSPPSPGAPAPNAEPTANKPPVSWKRRLKNGLKFTLMGLLAYVILVSVAHPVFVLFWRFLPLFVLAALGGLGVYLMRRRWRQGKGPSRKAAVYLSLAYLLFFAVVTFNNIATDVIRWQMAQALDPEVLNAIPDSRDNRFVARPTAS
ncbi:MAG TPA: hypothetical protein V6D17_24725, partial [Candidatus Obscuribacterales bacterium]